jgi:hypothetical protein
MIKKGIVLTVLLIMSSVFAGCASSRLAMDYGTSHNLGKFNQEFNTEAGKNLEPVYGLDGRLAEGVMKNYRAGGKK